MKIISWNVNRNNRRLSRDLHRFAEAGDDVICLQEYPAQRMATLRALFPHYRIAVAKEFFIHKNPEKSRKLYLVILTRHTILQEQVVKHEQLRRQPLRYRFFFSELDISYHYIDIAVAGQRYRIFNCHLECVASPSVRTERMNHILGNFAPDGINIVCGDFNAFSNSFVSLGVWWLFGNYSLRDFFVNERKLFNVIFEENQLNNVINGKRTFAHFPMQLDYILVPNSIPIRASRVDPSRYGSDHHPISIEI